MLLAMPKDSCPISWAADDLAHAAAQLSQEFPTVAKGQVFHAVNSAAPFVDPSDGRVQLMRKAREALRPVL